MDAWMQHIWQQPYDKMGKKAAQGEILPDLLVSCSTILTSAALIRKVQAESCFPKLASRPSER